MKLWNILYSVLNTFTFPYSTKLIQPYNQVQYLKSTLELYKVPTENLLSLWTLESFTITDSMAYVYLYLLKRERNNFHTGISKNYAC